MSPAPSPIPRYDQLVEGFYTTRLVPGGIAVPVLIWHGQPVIDGERQDRGPRWCCAVDGRSDRIERDDAAGYLCRVPLDPDETWPYCRRITAAEYAYMRRRAKWARAHAPDHPAANPRDPIDLRSLPPRF